MAGWRSSGHQPIKASILWDWRPWKYAMKQELSQLKKHITKDGNHLAASKLASIAQKAGTNDALLRASLHCAEVVQGSGLPAWRWLVTLSSATIDEEPLPAAATSCSSSLSRYLGHRCGTTTTFNSTRRRAQSALFELNQKDYKSSLRARSGTTFTLEASGAGELGEDQVARGHSPDELLTIIAEREARELLTEPIDILRNNDQNPLATTTFRGDHEFCGSTAKDSDKHSRRSPGILYYIFEIYRLPSHPLPLFRI